MARGDEEDIQAPHRSAGHRASGRKDCPKSRTHWRFSRQPGNARIQFRAGARTHRLAGDRLMNDYLQLEGKRALGTGGTSGIRTAIAAALHEAGATVLTPPRSRQRL